MAEGCPMAATERAGVVSHHAHLNTGEVVAGDPAAGGIR